MANANNGNHNILLCFCIYNFNLQCNKQRERTIHTNKLLNLSAARDLLMSLNECIRLSYLSVNKLMIFECWL